MSEASLSGDAAAASPRGDAAPGSPDVATRDDDAKTAASVGDVPPEEFRRLAHEVVDWMADYLAGLDALPVFPSDTRPGDVSGALPVAPPERGEPLDRALADFREIVVPGITHWNHPAFFAWFSITGSVPGILGEMLAAALNVNAMVWRSSPAATELEEVTTGWLRALLALPDAFDGVINDTASTSTMYALAAAREVAWPEAHRTGLFGATPGRVYASDQAHSSVEKAVLALGLGRNGYRTVASDAEHRMRPDALRAAIAEDLAAGVKPVAVVATLGTTSSASLDPVDPIAEIAAEHDAWLHVDAAYGGPAAIVPELRPLFTGWERADSIVVNPHKWLFTPVDCSILYSRRPEILVRAFSIVPEYLTSRDASKTRDLMDYGVALGRRFRSLKLWLVLRTFGREGIVARIREHVRLAKALAERIERTPPWALAAPVHLSTVAFRFAPDWDDGDALDRANHAIMERVNATGEAFLSHTVLDGRVALRISIGNLKTTDRHVERAWALLEEAATAVASEGPDTA